MKIIPYDKIYLDKFIDLYISFLEKDGEKWSQENAEYHLVEMGVQNLEKHSFVALSDADKLIGGIFAGEFPVWDTRIIQINFIGVLIEYQGQGVASSLFKHLYEDIKDKFRGISMDVDTSKSFPRDWYESMGLKSHEWRNYYADMNDLNL
jgi:ribosomal protein S18 acetylase RimI-like enzyme